MLLLLDKYGNIVLMIQECIHLSMYNAKLYTIINYFGHSGHNNYV